MARRTLRNHCGMSYRFFRNDTGDAFYEDVRATLDAAWGLPDAVTVTCIDPAAVAPRDDAGRIVLCVHEAWCEYTVAVDMLPDLLSQGAVAEITREEYDACRQSNIYG